MIAYEQSPAAIMQKSMQIVAEQTNLALLPPFMHTLVMRLVHTSGMVDIAEAVRFSASAVAQARSAIAGGAPILCDCHMVRVAIAPYALPANNVIRTWIDTPTVYTQARAQQCTRAAAGVDMWLPLIKGAIVVIGNAPTALFRLLEHLDTGWNKPAVIFAFPVGFVGAAEAKAELVRDPRGCDFVTLLGTRGGSAMAAAAVNACTTPPAMPKQASKQSNAQL